MSWEANNFCSIMYLELFSFPLPFFCRICSLIIKKYSEDLENLGEISIISFYFKFFLWKLKNSRDWNGGNLGVLFVCPELLIFILSSSAAWEIFPPIPNVKAVNEIGLVFYFLLQLSLSAALQVLCIPQLLILLRFHAALKKNPVSYWKGFTLHMEPWMTGLHICMSY